jgi:hypothetical protein
VNFDVVYNWPSNVTKNCWMKNCFCFPSKHIYSHLNATIWCHWCFWIDGRPLHYGHRSRRQKIINGEQKFAHWAFILEANNLQNTYMVILFGSFGAKNLFDGGKFVRNINGNPNSPHVDKLFFPNLYKAHILYILMDFYLILSRRVCPRSSRPESCKVGAP